MNISPFFTVSDGVATFGVNYDHFPSVMRIKRHEDGLSEASMMAIFPPDEALIVVPHEVVVDVIHGKEYRTPELRFFSVKMVDGSVSIEIDGHTLLIRPSHEVSGLDLLAKNLRLASREMEVLSAQDVRYYNSDARGGLAPGDSAIGVQFSGEILQRAMQAQRDGDWRIPLRNTDVEIYGENGLPLRAALGITQVMLEGVGGQVAVVCRDALQNEVRTGEFALQMIADSVQSVISQVVSAVALVDLDGDDIFEFSPIPRYNSLAATSDGLDSYLREPTDHMALQSAARMRCWSVVMLNGERVLLNGLRNSAGTAIGSIKNQDMAGVKLLVTQSPYFSGAAYRAKLVDAPVATNCAQQRAEPARMR